ncbi:MAG: hypothetical protein J5673_02000, partial [Candidatus Methanomethylophilaceae archaeon]|nr:hypothetical protein [Candidatus Methanomethylophilaceae archaeon]
MNSKRIKLLTLATMIALAIVSTAVLLDSSDSGAADVEDEVNDFAELKAITGGGEFDPEKTYELLARGQILINENYTLPANVTLGTSSGISIIVSS